MCGISGIYSKNDNLEDVLKKFNKCLSNRGPDYSSFFIDKKNYFGMGHTRLSILDLSERGNQPMYDHSGDWIISFNGEIYNHLEIRRYLSKKIEKQIKWKSESDTETILLANQILGLDKTLELLEGMFAFALYNKKENILYLVRDRIGEKPLYYYHHENKLVFGSDISIFKELKNINLSINHSVISEYFQKGNVSAPNSIYRHVFKLDPGCYIKLTNNFSLKINICYWNLKNIIKKKENNKIFQSNFHEQKKNLQDLLEKTVIKQTISDVQIGCFLSGGIDSSIITSILQRNSSKKIKTFTVGFNDKNFDESIQAKEISRYLGTDHYEYFIEDKDVFDFIENIENIYSEPFSDSSQIPTYLISKLMRKEAKVILSGDGGDEFYGGYNRYLYLNYIKFFSNNLPNKVKNKLNLFLKILPTHFLNKYLAFIDIKNFDTKIRKLINFIDTESDVELYNKMISTNSNQYLFLEKENLDKNYFYEKRELFDNLQIEENFMYLDQIDYLSNDVLCKVDRATMYNSVESRAPFLDHKLIENSWKIPLNYKIKGNNGKIILKEILKEYLPNKYIKKSKAGFAIPIDDLLRTKLKFWVEDLINSSTQINEYINYKNIKVLWEQHKKKQINAGGTLWTFLVLQNWFIKNQK